MSAFFEYPKSAAFRRVLPKMKIYEHGKVSTKLKSLFVTQVERIVWQYKLAPETINLPPTKTVPEIQIFHIALKTGELNEDLLRCIDRAIPFPLIFELHYGDKRKAVATFKRPNDADSAKWVIGDYFSNQWETDTAPRTPLPVALNLQVLYDKLITPLMPLTGFQNEPLQARVERMERIRATEREVAKIEARLAREKQFNKRVAINAELRDAKQKLQKLTHVAA